MGPLRALRTLAHGQRGGAGRADSSTSCPWWGSLAQDGGNPHFEKEARVSTENRRGAPSHLAGYLGARGGQRAVRGFLIQGAH